MKNRHDNPTPTQDERKSYWNDQYFDYWKARVEEAKNLRRGNSRLVEKDTITTPDHIYEELFSSMKLKEGSILDVGCGWGRFFHAFATRGLSIYGIDISTRMIMEARELKNPYVIELQESAAEKIPYEANFFDVVCCLGVFDATFQEDALGEMMRVTKIGGRIIVTGKNARYCVDDQAALAAEKGALQKGEPNFFTDVPLMLEQLRVRGHTVPVQLYYVHRGDFSENRHVTDIPARFYEYLFVIEKKTEQISFTKFSSSYSYSAQEA